jgi:hypothetical protein
MTPPPDQRILPKARPLPTGTSAVTVGPSGSALPPTPAALSGARPSAVRRLLPDASGKRGCATAGACTRAFGRARALAGSPTTRVLPGPGPGPAGGPMACRSWAFRPNGTMAQLAAWRAPPWRTCTSAVFSCAAQPRGPLWHAHSLAVEHREHSRGPACGHGVATCGRPHLIVAVSWPIPSSPSSPPSSLSPLLRQNVPESSPGAP